MSTRVSAKADEIAHAVQSDIVSGRLAPGSVLRQEHLAKSFRVSRTPVREALKSLHAAGLVSLIPHRGARVRTLSVDDLRERTIVRAELEGLAAELAAVRFTPEEMKRLRHAERQYARLSAQLRRTRGEDSSVSSAWMEANDDFHSAIIEASGIGLLSSLVSNMRRPFVALVLGRWSDSVDTLLTTTIRQHHSIRELLESGSGASARIVMEEHVVYSGTMIESLIASDDSTFAAGNLLQRMRGDPFWLRGSEPS